MYGTEVCMMSRIKLQIVFLVLICLVLASVFITLYGDFNVSVGRVKFKWLSSKSIVEVNRSRVILVYTNLFGSSEWYNLPAKEAANFASRCKFKNCEVTYDKSRLKESDAVVFHARDMPSSDFLQAQSKTSRPSNQRWAYFISENPVNTPDRKPLDGLFNWTMTYKKESDIWLPYKKYHKLKSSEVKTTNKDYAADKNKVANRKLAFWIVSHCGLYRDHYVHKLQEFISLDVAGGCAKSYKNPLNDCNKDGKDACMSKARNYKFYLSFENQFCNQYVTEKYWYNALYFDTVPIVMGSGPYDDPKVAIPGSYINVDDFPTVKALADYLNYLDKNDTAYNEYFKWKNNYKLDTDLGWPFVDIWVCEICKKLHTDRNLKTYHRLSDFWSWGDCKPHHATKVFEIIKRS